MAMADMALAIMAMVDMAIITVISKQFKNFYLAIQSVRDSQDFWVWAFKVLILGRSFVFMGFGYKFFVFLGKLWTICCRLKSSKNFDTNH